MLLVLVCLIDSIEAEMIVRCSVMLSNSQLLLQQKSHHHPEMNKCSDKISKHVDYIPPAVCEC